MMIKSNPWRGVLLFACGAFAALPLLFGQVSFLAFLSLLPYCLLLFPTLQTGDVRCGRIYRQGLLFWFGYFTVAFCFFPAMYPLGFAGIGKGAALAIVICAMTLLPLLQAAVFALSSLLLALLSRSGLYKKTLLLPLFFGTAVAIFFWLQNFTWLGVPWAPVSLPLARLPVFAGSASLFGEGFLVFFVAFLCGLCAEGIGALREKQSRHALLSFCLALLLFASDLVTGAILSSVRKADGEEIKVAVLQGNISSVHEWETPQNDILMVYRQLALDAAVEKPDVMLWTETVYTHPIEYDAFAMSYLASIAVQTKVPQAAGVFSAPDITPEREEMTCYNVLMIFYPDGTVSSPSYHKQHPVPFGEYVPWKGFFTTFFPALTKISLLSRDAAPDPDPDLLTLGDTAVGGLICFDSLYSSAARKSAALGAEIFFLPTNDSWFDGTCAKEMHLCHAVMRAIETGKPIVRAGNTGLSAVITGTGRITDQVPESERTYLIASVPTASGATLYTVIGDAFLYLCIALWIVLPALSVFAQIKSRKAEEKAAWRPQHKRKR